MLQPWARCLLAIALIPSSVAAFSLDLTFTGEITASQEATIREAADFWESQIIGYQPNISLTGIPVSVEGVNIDGPSGIMALAGPQGATAQGGFALTTSGRMRFDIPDLETMESDGSLPNIAVHELAHIIGFGQLWTYNNVYANGSGQYTGAFALDAYRSEFDPSATYVPVELEGGAGTADGHWDEPANGSSLTGITDPLGRDLANELMTGWYAPSPPTGGETFVSQTTLATFSDIGYVIAPEPAAPTLCSLGIVAVLAQRRRPSR